MTTNQLNQSARPSLSIHQREHGAFLRIGGRDGVEIFVDKLVERRQEKQPVHDDIRTLLITSPEAFRDIVLDLRALQELDVACCTSIVKEAGITLAVKELESHTILSQGTLESILKMPSNPVWPIFVAMSRILEIIFGQSTIYPEREREESIINNNDDNDDKRIRGNNEVRDEKRSDSQDQESGEISEDDEPQKEINQENKVTAQTTIDATNANPEFDPWSRVIAGDKLNLDDFVNSLSAGLNDECSILGRLSFAEGRHLHSDDFPYYDCPLSEWPSSLLDLAIRWCLANVSHTSNRITSLPARVNYPSRIPVVRHFNYGQGFVLRESISPVDDITIEVTPWSDSLHLGGCEWHLRCLESPHMNAATMELRDDPESILENTEKIKKETNDEVITECVTIVLTGAIYNPLALHRSLGQTEDNTAVKCTSPVPTTTPIPSTSPLTASPSSSTRPFSSGSLPSIDSQSPVNDPSSISNSGLNTRSGIPSSVVSSKTERNVTRKLLPNIFDAFEGQILPVTGSSTFGIHGRIPITHSSMAGHIPSLGNRSQTPYEQTPHYLISLPVPGGHTPQPIIQMKGGLQALASGQTDRHIQRKQGRQGDLYDIRFPRGAGLYSGALELFEICIAALSYLDARESRQPISGIHLWSSKVGQPEKFFVERVDLSSEIEAIHIAIDPSLLNSEHSKSMIAGGALPWTSRTTCVHGLIHPNSNIFALVLSKFGLSGIENIDGRQQSWSWDINGKRLSLDVIEMNQFRQKHRNFVRSSDQANDSKRNLYMFISEEDTRIPSLYPQIEEEATENRTDLVVHISPFR